MRAEATAGAVSWWLEAWAEGYGKKRAEYRRDGAASVDFRFDEPGTIEVTVAGASSGVYAGQFRVGVAGRCGEGGVLRPRPAGHGMRTAWTPPAGPASGASNRASTTSSSSCRAR